MKRVKQRPSYPIQKSTQQGIKDLNLRSESIKLVYENRGNNVKAFAQANTLGKTPQTPIIKTKQKKTNAFISK